jgi:ATP-binding cassette, subfamily B, bacterial PglK
MRLRPDILAGRRLAAEAADPEPSFAFPMDDIVWENVTFRYPETTAPAISNLSTRIRRQSITVLVGPSGSGKSTFADLLLGLLRPSSGSIRVGGIDVRDHVRSWQRGIGYVPQNIFVLDDSVAANISFGSHDDIDMAMVKRAAAYANIDRFFESIPGGYGFRVGENGAMLSGGQRQRLGLARALYHDADVLVLDEATSALDTVTEREIIGTLTELKREKTIIMIAHRLATIKCADTILFIKDGSLQAHGDFESLMVRDEEFRAFINAGVDGHAAEVVELT